MYLKARERENERALAALKGVCANWTLVDTMVVGRAVEWQAGTQQSINNTDVVRLQCVCGTQESDSAQQPTEANAISIGREDQQREGAAGEIARVHHFKKIRTKDKKIFLLNSLLQKYIFTIVVLY